MKKSIFTCAVLCLFAARAISQTRTVRIPAYPGSGTSVVYVPGETVYHLTSCPKISGVHVYWTNIWTAQQNEMKPCEDCLYRTITVSGGPLIAVAPDAVKLVASWEGSANKNTETFEVTAAEWKIEWSTVGEGNFIVTLYRASDDRHVDLVVNVVGDNVDSSVMRGKGTYYLKIQTTQKYKITVYDKGR